MTPTHLAAYIARGVSAVDPFDLPALLDALRAERASQWAQRGVTTFGTRHPVNRLDAAIAEIEYTLNPCPDTAAVLRRTAERVALDVCACIDHGETP